MSSIAQNARALARKIVRRLGGAGQRPEKVRWQEWSIGIYTGPSPGELGQPSFLRNPVLTWRDVSDVPAALVADPFMLEMDGSWHMFFEVLNRDVMRGEIGWATSPDGLSWTYRNIVLAEPFHLSYPYVFEWEGSYYMIPETSKAESVRLYRAGNFPEQWNCVAELCKGGRFADTSILRHKDKWWLFTECGPGVKTPVLRLYMADDLHGPYTEHPCSPIMEGNAHISRPGGKVIANGMSCVRYTQDVAPVYGSQVRAFEITQLSPTAYQERPLSETPIVSAGTAGWNEGGMHHVDVHRIGDGNWLAAVDGFRWIESSRRWERR